MKKFREFIYHRHDVFCNQKYADTLPYSTHLGFVEAQGEKFIHLVREGNVINHENERSERVPYKDIVRCALIAHDSLEDARMTYNDVLKEVNLVIENYKAAVMVADIVYCVTDEKGKDRAGRKNDKYKRELRENELAIFVKLSDLAANMLFSRLSGSSMYAKYKKEWVKFRSKMYFHDYNEFFEYIDTI